MAELHFPAGAAADGGDQVLVTPETAGWQYVGLRVLRLGPGQSRELVTGTAEIAVLPLSGGCVLECDGRRFELQGRASVFDRVTDFAYVPRDAEVRVTAPAGGEFALPMAEASRRLEVVYGAAQDVPVEVRGAGHSTRQINNFMSPTAFPASDRLTAVEVLTPEGNWSSYPPHKHDEASECEAILEEIYYFRIRGEHGFGVHKTYAADGAFDVTVTVRDGDVFLIPRGYHGPSIAPPGYPMYYLNVLAGPADERTMTFCDDPVHTWVRDTWADIPVDPRIPMTSAEGPVS
jgi:5-deoxy-glucuronate isomerase